MADHFDPELTFTLSFEYIGYIEYIEANELVTRNVAFIMWLNARHSMLGISFWLDESDEVTQQDTAAVRVAIGNLLFVLSNP